MFDFEKLDVFHKTSAYNIKLDEFLDSKKLDFTTQDQLKRASLSIMLNISEGSGRRTPKDKRHFFVISRGSTFECAGVFIYLKNKKVATEEEFKKFYNILEEISKMLFAMINRLS
ncbi:MAG: four helix bundle protein [Crocinitomicaceae bacterium]